MADRHRRDDDDRKSRRDEDRYHRSKAQKRSRSDSRSRHRRHRSSEEREIDIEAETRRINEIQANIDRQRQRDREREESNRRKAHKSESSRSNRDVSTQSNVDSSRQTTKYNEGDIVTQYKIIRNNSNQAPKTTSTETRTENVVSNENTTKEVEKKKKKKKKKSKSPEKVSQPINRDAVPVAIPLPPKNDCRTVATLSQPSTSSQSFTQHPSTIPDLESERRGGPQQANYASHRPVTRRSDGKPQPRPPYNADTLPRPPDHNCYNCSNPDHYDYECPKWEDGPRCFRCSEWGHFGTTCYNPRVFYKHEFAKYRDSSRDNRIRDTINGAAQLISGERQPEDFMGIPRFDRDARNDIEENRRRHQSSSRYRSPDRDEQHRSRSSPPRETDKSSRSATDRDATQTENRRQSSSTHSSASGPSPPPGRGRSMARPEGARRLRNFPAMLVDPHIEEESPYTSFLLMELPDIDVNSLNGTQAGLIYNHIAKWEQMLAWFRTRVELRIHAINVEARKPTEIEPVFDIGGVEYSSFLDTVGPAIIGQPMVQPPPGFPPIPPVPKPVYLEHTKEQTMLPFTNTPQPGTSASTSKTEKPVEMNPIGCIKAPENKTEKGSSPNKPQTKAAKKEGTSTDEIFKKFREQNPNAGKSPLNLGKVYNPRRDARTPKKTDTNREGPEHRKPTKPTKLDRTIAAPKPPTPPPMPEKPLWEVKSTKAVTEAEMDTTAQSEAKTDNEWNKPGPSSAQSNATEKPHLNSLGQDMNAPWPRTPEIIRQNLLIRPDIPCEEEWEIGDGEVIDRRRANYRSVNFMYVKQIMELNFTKVNERLTEIETRLHREQVPDEADEGRPMPDAERALLTRQQEELNDAAMAITRVLEDPGSIEDAIEGLHQLIEMSRIYHFALDEHPQRVLMMLRTENLTIDERRRQRNRERRHRNRAHRRNADNVDDGIDVDYFSDSEDRGPGDAAPNFQLLGERLLDEAYQRRNQHDNDDQPMG
ncbi:uncharacterized protein svp isoform X2 [Planococcus citri]|uniref:uncharacterized protein svp isoform X2 n=1 Tax=Planococcus citri TaxID=170843 RepID=UPI0031F871FF